MKPFQPANLLAVALWFLILRTASAQGAVPEEFIRDQVNENWGAYLEMTLDRPIAQTFKPRISGRLHHMDVLISFPAVGPTYPYFVTLVETEAGFPTSRSVGRTVLTPLTEIVLNEPIYLRSNVVYAMVFRTDFLQALGFGTSSGGDTYLDGWVLQKDSESGEWHGAVYFGEPPVLTADLTFATHMVPGLPEVWIVEPRPNASFSPETHITLRGETASNAPGDILNYYGDGVLLGSAAAGASFAWSGALPGPHTLIAVADNGSGTISTSAPVTVVVRSRQGNDAFADRVILSGEYVHASGANEGASSEAGEPAHGTNASGASVWWSWTASRTGPVTITTGRSLATNLLAAVYLGSSVEALAFQTGGAGEFLLSAVAGQSYAIAVDTVGTACTNILLDVAESDLRLVKPDPGQTFTVPAPVVTRVERTFGTREIVQVELLQDGAALATNNSLPFEVSPPSSVPGGHVLTAAATDTLGIRTVSAPLHINVRPQNDDFRNAIELVGYDASINASTRSGTLQVREGEFRFADNVGGHSIWYWWRAPELGICRLTGNGPGSGLLFQVYGGPGPGLFTLDIVNGGGSGITFLALSNQVYWISVDGFLGEEGDISFQLRFSPPNDDLAQASILTGVNDATYANLRGATRETGEPILHSAANARSLWWIWTAPITGVATLSCLATNDSPALAVYTGTTYANLALVARQTRVTNDVVQLSFAATEGRTYAIALEGTNVVNSSLQLQLTMELIRLTSPRHGQPYAFPSRVLLTVQLPASFPNLRPPVRYYDGDRLLGQVAQPPYSFVWDAAPGVHSLIAEATDGLFRKHHSLPVTILVHTNDQVPTPKLAAWSSTSYAVTAFGQLYIWGTMVPGGFGLPGTYHTYPTLAKFPPGVTGWSAIGGTAWALGNDGVLYQYGVTPTPPAPGATGWNYLRDQFMIDNLGRLYFEGLIRGLNDPIPFQGPYPWLDVSGYLSLTTNRVLYQFDGVSFNPVPVPAGVTSWKAISAGEAHYLALGDNGELYTWGFNYSGQLGLGHFSDRATPSLVPRPVGVTNWTAICGGGHHSLAIGSDGQIYNWGRNWENQLGLGYITNNVVPRPTPVIVPEGVTRWTMICAGQWHSLAIGDDCRLYGWGSGAIPGGGPPFPAPVPGLVDLCAFPVIQNGSSQRLPDGNFLIEFRSELNRLYTIQYSSDSTDWISVYPSILGTGEVLNWLDDGPPKTESSPATQPSRFYRVISGQ